MEKFNGMGKIFKNYSFVSNINRIFAPHKRTGRPVTIKI